MNRAILGTRRTSARFRGRPVKLDLAGHVAKPPRVDEVIAALRAAVNAHFSSCRARLSWRNPWARASRSRTVLVSDLLTCNSKLSVAASRAVLLSELEFRDSRSVIVKLFGNQRGIA